MIGDLELVGIRGGVVRKKIRGEYDILCDFLGS